MEVMGIAKRREGTKELDSDGKYSYLNDGK